MAWNELSKQAKTDETLLRAVRNLAFQTELPNGKQPSPRQSPSLADVDALRRAGLADSAVVAEGGGGLYPWPVG